MILMKKGKYTKAAAVVSVCFFLSGCGFLDAPPAEQVEYLADGASSLYDKIAAEVNGIISSTAKETEEVSTGSGIGNSISNFFDGLDAFNRSGLEHIVNGGKNASEPSDLPQKDTENETGGDFYPDVENEAKNAFDEAFESNAEGALTKVNLDYVVDGDTLCISLGSDEAHVRLIGINTPESVHPDETRNTDEGKIASDYTRELLVGYEYVYLEFDKSEYDDYGRILAYVWLNNDTSDLDNMLNAVLLKAGVAELMTVEPNTKYTSCFSSLLNDGK